MQLTEFLHALLGALHRAGISYCILRNYETLPYINAGGDIDILISKCDRHEILCIIAATPGCRITALSPRWYVTGVFIDGIENSSGHSALQIDLVTSLAWKSFVYLDAQVVLKASQPHGNLQLIRKPTPYHEAIISLFSSYLVGGWVNDRYQSRVVETFRVHFREIHACLAPTLGNAVTRKLIDAVMEDRRSALIELLPELKRRLVGGHIRQHGLSFVCAAMHHLVAELRMRYTPQCIAQICVLGMDGAGKSTVVKRLIDNLGPRAKDVEVIHLKPRFGRGRSEAVVVSDPHALPPRSVAASIFKLSTWIIAYYRKRVLHGHKAFTLVIWDRYIYDVLVDPLRYRIALPTWVLKMFCRMAPRVDGLLVLDITADLAYERKPEVALERLRPIREAYLALPDRLGMNDRCAIIHTDLPVDESSKQALEFVTRTLASRVTLRPLGSALRRTDCTSESN